MNRAPMVGIKSTRSTERMDTEMTHETIGQKMNETFISMGLDVRAYVATTVVRLMSNDRDQLELAASIALNGAMKAFPRATIGEAYEGRRSGWVREIVYA